MSDGVTDQDIVIIGAGAAGLGAASHLSGKRLSALVLEARDRIGGRAHTVTIGNGFRADLGCNWLHSADRNPLVPIARQSGFTIDEKMPEWGSRLLRSGLGESEAEDLDLTRARFFHRLEQSLDGPDCPASTLLEPGNRWNPLLNAISSFVNGAELDRISAHDYASYEDSGINWRVIEGYGTLMEKIGSSLKVHLGVEVMAIDWRGAIPVIETSKGNLTAKAVIITIPPGLLSDGMLRFVPSLPADKCEAALHLPLGVNNKLFFGLDGDWPELLPDTHCLGSADRIATAAIQVKPHGKPIVEIFLGGSTALGLEREGPGAAYDFALGEIAHVFGSHILSALKPLAHSAWASDRFARGAYSHALPGYADKRAVLARPLDQRLYFAGEATHPEYFSTAHGAYLSGIRAAKEALDALQSKPSQIESI